MNIYACEDHVNAVLIDGGPPVDVEMLMRLGCGYDAEYLCKLEGDDALSAALSCAARDFSTGGTWWRSK